MENKKMAEALEYVASDPPRILVSKMGSPEIRGLFSLYKRCFDALEPGQSLSPGALDALKKVRKALGVDPQAIIEAYRRLS